MTLREYTEGLQRHVDMYRYDNQVARSGSRKSPSGETQRKATLELIQDMEFDFLPKKSNQLYHVVSMDWWQCWQKFIGVEAVQQDEDVRVGQQNGVK